MQEGEPPHYRVLVVLTSTQHRTQGEEGEDEEEVFEEGEGARREIEDKTDEVKDKQVAVIKKKDGEEEEEEGGEVAVAEEEKKDESDRFLDSILKNSKMGKLLPRSKCMRVLLSA